jgi:hypothetical protein
MRPLAQGVATSMLALEQHLLAQSPTEPAMEAALTVNRIVHIEAEIKLAGTPEAVFAALTTGLDGWWPHRARDGAHIVYEPRVGGCYFEDWGEGAGLLYGHVVVFEPPRRVITMLSGGYGASLVHKKIVEALEPAGDATLYKRALILSGEVSEEMEAMYRTGVAEVVDALKRHLDTRA